MSVAIFELEAEQAALGAMLSNTAAAERGVATLRRDDFYRERERCIFDAIASAVHEGASADVVTVATQMGADPELRAYVVSLPESCPTATGIGSYIDIVQQSFARRRLLTAIEEMQAAASANGLPVNELHRRCADLLAGAAPTTANGRETTHGRPRSYDAPEVAAMVFADPDPVLLYAERGTTFDLVGKMKKGKTTFILLGCRAVLRGERFLDLPTKRVPILYATELTRKGLQQKLRALGMLTEPELHALFRSDFIGFSWAQICELLGEEVQRLQIGLLVIDTLSDWAKLSDENDAAEALRVMDPLRSIAENNVAVITVRHAGKGEHDAQDVVDVGRGSSAFAGAVDTLCVLGNAPGAGHPNRRQLRFVSRKDDVQPTMIAELQGGQYVTLGSAANVEYVAARDFVLAHLPIAEADAITEAQLLALCDKLFSRSTLKRVLNGERGEGGLLREGLVTGKLGAGGVSSKAFGYWLISGDDQLGFVDAH